MTIITKHNPKFHNAFPYFDRPVLINTQLARNQFSGKPHNYTLNNCNYNYSSKPDIEQTFIRKEREKKSPAQSTTVAVSSIKLQHFQWNKPKARHWGGWTNICESIEFITAGCIMQGLGWVSIPTCDNRIESRQFNKLVFLKHKLVRFQLFNKSGTLSSKTDLILPLIKHTHSQTHTAGVGFNKIVKY